MSYFVDHKNISIHFTDQGKGNAVVLLHGFLENVNMWNKIIPHISRKNRVICIDLLGHGKTGSLGGVHSMEDMAEGVITILKHLRIRRIVLIGHSMGGYVSLAFAQIYPKMIKGLCLMNSTTISDSLEKRRNRDRAILAVKENYKMFIRIAIPNLFAASNRSYFTTEINRIIDEALKIEPRGIIAALEGMKSREDRTALFKNGSYKKLVLLGNKDPILNYGTLRRQLRSSDASIVELSGGHMSHIESIKEFTYNILHFIENI